MGLLLIASAYVSSRRLLGGGGGVGSFWGPTRKSNRMVSLGFFQVAGANDLPYVSSDVDASNDVQRSLVSFAASSGVAEAGVRQASLWNLPLCQSCISMEDFPVSTLYKRPELQDLAQKLVGSVATSVSSASAVQGWLAGPRGVAASGSSCWSACAPFPQTTNFYAGGFERPYGRRYGFD